MRALLARLRGLSDNRLGSVPLQYAIVAAGTAVVTLGIVQITSTRVADKLNAVTSALNKVQF